MIHRSLTALVHETMTAMRSRAPSTSSRCEGDLLEWRAAGQLAGHGGGSRSTVRRQHRLDRMIADLLSSLPLSVFLVLKHRLQQILICHCYNELTDERPNRHVPERRLKREFPDHSLSKR